jgi:hypothetical protein
VSARNSIAALAALVVLATPALASDEGYIYGKVVTTGGESYEGEIRWGTEESFWDDMFNADKASNDNLDYVSHRDLDHVRARHWETLLGIGDLDLTHLLAVRFGDLKRLEVRGSERAIAEFRNGEEMELRGGSNDIGARLTVVDPRRGRQEIRWNRIRTVEFKDTPSHLEGKLGEPLYGTVRAGRYDYTGRIQWDSDECLSIDTLDGDTPDGRAHVAFEDIASIRKYRAGSLVRLKSGEELYLTGTNDVNHENRGVVVTVEGMGSAKIGWADFESVTFQRAPEGGPSYADFGQGRHLAGRVQTSGGRHDGRIIFDLDESCDFELLQGNNGATEFLIPFRDIASIRPEGSRGATVELRTGMSVELEDSHDVTRKNDGLLVFDTNRDPTYIDWRDVREVVFR